MKTIDDTSESEKLLQAIILGTQKAYDHRGLPFTHITLESFEDIAAFMQFKMIETMFLGKLLHVNAFDQPNVELYKKETLKIISNN